MLLITQLSRQLGQEIIVALKIASYSELQKIQIQNEIIRTSLEQHSKTAWYQFQINKQSTAGIWSINRKYCLLSQPDLAWVKNKNTRIINHPDYQQIFKQTKYCSELTGWKTLLATDLNVFCQYTADQILDSNTLIWGNISAPSISLGNSPNNAEPLILGASGKIAIQGLTLGNSSLLIAGGNLDIKEVRLNQKLNSTLYLYSATGSITVNNINSGNLTLYAMAAKDTHLPVITSPFELNKTIIPTQLTCLGRP